MGLSALAANPPVVSASRRGLLSGVGRGGRFLFFRGLDAGAGRRRNVRGDRREDSRRKASIARGPTRGGSLVRRSGPNPSVGPAGLRRSPRPGRPWGCVFLLFGVLLVGCSEDRNPAEPRAPGALTLVHGVLRGGEGPVDGRVTASSVAPFADSLRQFEFSSEVDTSGVFALRLPPGAYRLAAWTSGAYGYYSRRGLATYRDYDTLRVGGESVRADIIGAGFRVHVALPGSVDWRSVDCSALSGRNGAQSGRNAAGGYGTVDFRFPFLVPGWYHFRLQGPEWSTGALRPVGADSDSVFGVVGKLGVVELSLGPLARVSGRVSGSWQRFFVHEPRVELWSTARLPVASVDTDQAGAYSFQCPGPVDGRIRVLVGGIGAWLGGEDFEHASVLRLAAGAETTGVDVVESGILLRIVRPSGEMQDGATLKLLDANRRDVTEGRISLDPRNPLPLPNLRPGKYRLLLSPAPQDTLWAAQWYDRASREEDATPIEVAPGGEVVPIRLTMTRRSGGKSEAAP
jgi:hypothetical protein